MNNPYPVDGWTCPLPLRDHDRIMLGHGGGGKLSSELIEHLFLPAFRNTCLDHLGDAAVLSITGQRLAMSTDSFVVQPLFFPGGCIGDLAVHGTINDLAMSGATPVYLSASFIIEEGLPLATLGGIVNRMGDAVRQANVQIITGDTKVVDKGHGDGVYINTTGIGIIPADVNIAPHHARAGDQIILSGTIGDHGMAIMSVREGLEFETCIESDTAPLHNLVASMLDVSRNIHVLRDPTRGGVASALNEIAKASQVGMVIDETALPINPAVQAACELLGMDPLYVANEGKLLAIVPAEDADSLLATMSRHSNGRQAAIIGAVVAKHPGMVVAKTAIGGTRVIDTQIGEQLPRIC